MVRSLAREKTSEKEAFFNNSSIVQAFYLSIHTLNSNDCADQKGQKIYYSLHYYQGVFGNRPLHMQFVQRTKDNVNICFTCSSTQTAV